jgi:23S rRNA (uracil1939-C5)-methyltransferase
MSTVEVTATAMAAGGDALAREPSGRVVFVEGALPGERVVVELTQQRKDFARGRVVDVLDPSPDRLDDGASGCGGCQWRHIAPAAQARLKREIVADALRRIAKLNDPPLASDVLLPDDPRRTTVRAGVADGRAGFRRRHGHELVVGHDCPIAHPVVHEVLREGTFDGADEIVVRVSLATGERLVVADPSADGVRVPSDVIVVEPGQPAAINEDAAGRRWRVSADSFFQPSPGAADLLAAAVRALAGDEAEFVVDAYAGVGLLGGSLAPARLVAVESSPSAVADAQVNLADLDATVVEGEVADVMSGAGAGDVDLVIADPARPGLGRAAATALAETGAPQLVLVSCDPASLARDVGLLDGLGYRLLSAQVVDLFPHTFHLEVVTAFERA